MRWFQAAVDVGKPDKEEGDAEEEPGECKDPDRRLETEEQVPNDGCAEEDRAKNVQINGCLSTLTREQDDLVTGRAQRLQNGQPVTTTPERNDEPVRMP